MSSTPTTHLGSPETPTPTPTPSHELLGWLSAILLPLMAFNNSILGWNTEMVESGDFCVLGATITGFYFVKVFCVSRPATSRCPGSPENEQRHEVGYHAPYTRRLGFISLKHDMIYL
ncbi:hypothetical protein DER46DRAFT_506650 [Fusarium sp. MPI-SDFR-AT-0072]|nr:hypothetical protein DER46DRAFT_506650 [Fusarium sp. MPI-SDFR-AT-0072]